VNIIAAAEGSAPAAPFLQLGPEGLAVLLAVAALLLLKSKTGRAGASAVLRRAGRAVVRWVRITLWAARLRMPIRLGYRLQPEVWREMCAARKLAGLKRGRVTRTPAGIAIRVTLGGALDLATLQARVDQLETGLGVKRRAIRIEPGARADRAVVHIVLRDPLRRPVLWSGHAAGTVTVPAEVATTPHGDRVTVELLRRWLIAGTTGSGKSLYARLMAAAVATAADGRLTYCDPKRVEGEQWRHLATVACTPAEIGEQISAFRRRMDERLQDMARRKVTTHQPTAEAPAEVLLIDEAADVVRSITDEQLDDLHAIAEQGRAPRFVLWIGIQDPRGDNLPRGITTQLQAIAGLKLRDSTEAAVVFGRSARRDGWTPERLPGGGGWVLVKDDEHPDPEPARADLLDEKTLRGLRRPAGARPGLQKPATAPQRAPRPVRVPSTPADARSAVLDALRAAPGDGTGAAELQKVTGLGKSRVYELLAQLVDEGQAVKVRQGRFACVATPVSEGRAVA
jgi:adenosyl cobinamide kinase/adenosyl cobinamide phosphate guanylyltransferase